MKKSFKQFQEELLLKKEMEKQLFSLVEEHNVAALNDLINNVEPAVDINAKNKAGETPLMKAADAGDTAIVKELLDAKANPNIKAKDGHIALSHVSRHHPTWALLAPKTNQTEKDKIENEQMKSEALRSVKW